VGIGVGDAVKDGVVLEEQLEAADVLAQRETRSRKPRLSEISRQGRGMPPAMRPVRAREPPVTNANSAARMQVSTARVSSQPEMSCQAGRVKR